MRFILMLLCLVYTLPLSAQKQIERKKIKGALFDFSGYHITDARLDKFVGTWEWQQNGKTFRLLLEKVEKFDMKPKFKIDLKVDMIRGKYIYSEDSSISHLPWNDHLFMEVGTTIDKRTLSFVVADGRDGHMYGGKFIIDKKNPDQATFKFYQFEKWKIRTPEGIIPKKLVGVELPTGINGLRTKVLKRVSG